MNLRLAKNSALLNMVELIMSSVEPTLKAEVESFAINLYKKAETTTNPWDNILIHFIVAILGLEIPKN